MHLSTVLLHIFFTILVKRIYIQLRYKRHKLRAISIDKHRKYTLCNYIYKHSTFVLSVIYLYINGVKHKCRYVKTRTNMIFRNTLFVCESAVIGFVHTIHRWKEYNRVSVWQFSRWYIQQSSIINVLISKSALLSNAEFELRTLIIKKYQNGHVITFKWANCDGLAQDCSNTIALAMELLQSCVKPSKWSYVFSEKTSKWAKNKRHGHILFSFTLHKV